MIITHLSPSSLAELSACPSLFKATRLDNVPKGPATAKMNLGTNVEQNVARTLGFKTKEVLDPEGTPLVRDFAAEAIAEQYMAHPQALPHRSPTEYQKEVLIDPSVWERHGLEPLPLFLKGFIDFKIGDTIVDLKVGMAPDRQRFNGWLTQLVTYAVAEGAPNDLPPLEIHHIKPLKKGAQTHIFKVFPNQDMVTLVHDEFRQAMHMLEIYPKIGWPARIGFRCSTCPVKHTCKAYQTAVLYIPEKTLGEKEVQE